MPTQEPFPHFLDPLPATPQLYSGVLPAGCAGEEVAVSAPTRRRAQRCLARTVGWLISSGLGLPLNPEQGH